MIRQAERSDRDQLYDLYRMLVPNSKKIFEREGYDGSVSKGFKKYF